MIIYVVFAGGLISGILLVYIYGCIVAMDEISKAENFEERERN